MVQVLFVSEFDDPTAWRSELARHNAPIELVVWPGDVDVPAVDVSAVEIALAYKPPSGLLRSLPRLRAVLSLAAGLDHLDGDRGPNPGVPVVPLRDPDFARIMAEYVLTCVMRHHREFHRFTDAQARREWRFRPPLPASQRTVGILGLGPLGQGAAALLAAVGFKVLGWSRSHKAVPGTTVFNGPTGLLEIAKMSEVLVCLLPLTSETSGILDRRLFGLMPPGASLVNVGRGRHLVEVDLLEALDTGHLSGATLDVMATEPPEPAHPFWTHPGILLTPHVAAFPRPETAALVIAETIERIIGSSGVITAPRDHNRRLRHGR
jgi:glyoxylate/hydroxypyruvate reductase A